MTDTGKTFLQRMDELNDAEKRAANPKTFTQIIAERNAAEKRAVTSETFVQTARARKRAAQAAQPQRPTPPAPVSTTTDNRGYRTLLQRECEKLANTPRGRNQQLNNSAFDMAGFVAAGHLDRQEVEDALIDAGRRASSIGDHPFTDKEMRATLKSAIDSPNVTPKTLAEPPINGHVTEVDDLAAITDHGDYGDDDVVKTVPWPTLDEKALHGAAGRIVRSVEKHTEADPAAILVQLLAVFGANVGPSPHIVAGNARHRAIINPLIVGRTNSGAKGTGLGLVETVRKRAFPGFDELTTSGLSSAEGLIELVRDPSGMPDDKDFDPGAPDKRLLVKESEYGAVLQRSRREGNTLGMTLRQAWDGDTLRTLTRKTNKLTATAAHIVIVGHITPREFRDALRDSDMAGGSVNRLLICLSRRSRLHSRLGNLPEDVLTDAANLFKSAADKARVKTKLDFTAEFWARWDDAYQELNRDRPDSWATDATARAVPMVLRLALLYALFDDVERIDVDHLDAALALWSYADHSARWLFSTHELEVERDSIGGLAAFIRDAGEKGRTRTEISVDHFNRHKSADEINLELTPLVHDGIVLEVKSSGAGRPTTRYVHRTCEKSELAKKAGQDTYPVRNKLRSMRNKSGELDPEGGLNSPFFGLVRTPKPLLISLIRLIRLIRRVNRQRARSLPTVPARPTGWHGL